MENKLRAAALKLKANGAGCRKIAVEFSAILKVPTMSHTTAARLQRAVGKKKPMQKKRVRKA